MKEIKDKYSPEQIQKFVRIQSWREENTLKNLDLTTDIKKFLSGINSEFNNA